MLSLHSPTITVAHSLVTTMKIRKKILRDMVLHPNAGAVLVVGLGCENNQPDVFREFLGDFDQDRVKFMVTQKVGDEYEEGMEILRDLYAEASKDERTEVPLSELRVGLKCGGSDGFSGITANPLLGMFSDFLDCARVVQAC